MAFAIAVVLLAANVYFAIALGPTLFPGDPPVADILVELATAALVYIGLGAGVAFASSRASPQARLPLATAKLGVFLLLISVLGSLPSLLEVGKRHFGRWNELRGVLKQNETRVLQLADRKGGTLSPEEVAAAKTWFKLNPVQFDFGGDAGAVEVRLMSNAPPYVGVDFGDGQNAVFDVTTMLCTYSD